MKKNLFLFFAFATLLSLTYFYEEVGKEQARLAEQKRKLLFNDLELKNFHTIKGKFFHLVRVGEGFKTQEHDYPVAAENLQSFLTTLSQIRMVRSLEDNEVFEVKKTFDPSSPSVTFVSEQTKVRFILGRSLGFQGQFYFKVEREEHEKYLVVEESSRPRFVMGAQKREEIDLGQRKIHQLLSMTDHFFYDKKIINEKLDQVTFSRKLYRPFTIYFKDYKTQPTPPRGLAMNRELIDKMSQKLTQLKAQHILFNFQRDQLSLPMAELSWGQNKLTVYQQYKGKTGVFALHSKRKPLYQIEPAKEGSPFFVQLNDFWQDKLWLDDWKQKQWEVTFFQKKAVPLWVEVDNPYRVIDTRDKAYKTHPSRVAFGKLFHFLKTQKASRVLSSPLPEGMQPAALQLQADRESYKLIIQGEQLLVYDEKKQLLWYYWMGREFPFTLDYEDYFLG